MSPSKAPVSECYLRFRKPGLAALKLAVRPDGSVETVRMISELAGTPEGDCIVEVIKQLRFPTFEGGRFEFCYPFMLR